MPLPPCDKGRCLVRAEAIRLGFCRSAGCDWGGLSATLAELGLELAEVSLVRAREAEVENALKDALARSQVVILTGGPDGGADELVRKTVARAFGKRLILQPDLLKRLEGASGRAGVERPALLPTGSKAFASGGRLGFHVEKAGHIIIYAPGAETGETGGLTGQLEGLFRVKSGRRFERSRILRCSGIEEARAKELLKGLGQGEAFSYAASLKGLDIKIMVAADSSAKAEQALDEAAFSAVSRLGDSCYGTDAEKMEDVVARLLTEKEMTVATAESCTGGLLAKRLTDVPGSSAYMDRGVVTYSNKSKEELLGVPARTLEDYGAVSKETAQAMARGIRESAKADIGISITGIAGPSGGTPTKPVGLVYIGLATPEGVTVKGYNLPGTREEVRFATSQRALDLLRRYLL